MSLISSVPGLGDPLKGGLPVQPNITQKLEGLSGEAGQFKIGEQLSGAKALTGLGKTGDVSTIGNSPHSIRNLSGSGNAPSFGEMLEGLVDQVSHKSKIAKAEANKVMNGETDNLHQSVIAMQESGVAFTMLVEVRNKLQDSYQQLMKMSI